MQLTLSGVASQGLIQDMQLELYMIGYVLAYRIRGNFGGDFNLAIRRILDHAAKLKSRQYNWSFVIIRTKLL